MENRENKYFQVLKDLVSFDTRANTSKTAIADYISDIFSGGAMQIVKDYGGVIDPTQNSIVATIGDAGRPGIILSGHLDVADVSDDWATDPWKLTARGECLYGRGTADMRGAIAVALSKIPEFKKISTDMPIHFVMTHDEETSFTGIKQLIENDFYGLIAPRQLACVVMEPTGNTIVNRHNGMKKILVDTNGQFTQRKLAWNAWHDGMFKPLYKAMNKTEDDEIFSLRQTGDDKFDVSLFHDKNDLVAINDFAKMFRDYIIQSGMKIIEKAEYPTFDAAGIVPGRAERFGTEAGFYQAYGIPTIIYGPGEYHGNCHAANERVSLTQLAQFDRKLTDIIHCVNKREK